MSLGLLVRRHLTSHPVRSSLTIGAVIVAVFLFCFLRSIVTTLEGAVKASATNRIMVTSAVSLFQSLPTAYKQTVADMEGVESVVRHTWFGGYYREPQNFFAQFATDARTVLEQYPEVLLPDAEKQAWFEDRQGCIIGVGLAEKYGWKVGDTIPIIGAIYPKRDGSEWGFRVHGVYKSGAANLDDLTLFFHFEYLDEMRKKKECDGPDGTSILIVRMKAGTDPAAVSRAIDDHFDAGPQRTLTMTEAAFQASFINMLGNVPTFLGMIGGAVLVALLFGVVNTMTLAARERTRTTGILKSLGFRDRVPARLYLLEALALVGFGGAVGIGLAVLIQAPVRAGLGARIPNYALASETVAFAVAVCVVIALLAGLVPAWAALRLRPAESLRRGG